MENPLDFLTLYLVNPFYFEQTAEQKISLTSKNFPSMELAYKNKTIPILTYPCNPLINNKSFSLHLINDMKALADAQVVIHPYDDFYEPYQCLAIALENYEKERFNLKQGDKVRAFNINDIKQKLHNASERELALYEPYSVEINQLRRFQLEDERYYQKIIVSLRDAFEHIVKDCYGNDLLCEGSTITFIK